MYSHLFSQFELRQYIEQTCIITQTHAGMHTHTHAHAHTRTHTHAHARARTHAHTHLNFFSLKAEGLSPILLWNLTKHLARGFRIGSGQRMKITRNR